MSDRMEGEIFVVFQVDRNLDGVGVEAGVLTNLLRDTVLCIDVRS